MWLSRYPDDGRHSRVPPFSGRGRVMGWLRIELTDQEQAAVNAERDRHSAAHVRRKLLVLWLLHCGLTRQKAAHVAGLGRATVQRYVAAYRGGGLEGLRRWDVKGPVSDRQAHRDKVKQEFARRPARTVAEAAERIEALTGIRRQPSQTRHFLKGLGLSCQRVRAVPVPPKRRSRST
jgi:transposase